MISDIPEALKRKACGEWLPSNVSSRTELHPDGSVSWRALRNHQWHVLSETYYQNHRATSQKLRYVDAQIPDLELIKEGCNLFSAEGQFESISQNALSADTSTKRGAQNRILAVAGKLPTRSVHKTEEQLQEGQAQCPFCTDGEVDNQEHFFGCMGTAIPALAIELRKLKRGHHLSMIASMHKWEIPGMERISVPLFPSTPWAKRIKGFTGTPRAESGG